MSDWDGRGLGVAHPFVSTTSLQLADGEPWFRGALVASSCDTLRAHSISGESFKNHFSIWEVCLSSSVSGCEEWKCWGVSVAAQMAADRDDLGHGLYCSHSVNPGCSNKNYSAVSEENYTKSFYGMQKQHSFLCWKTAMVALLTLSVCIVPPRKATGDSKVGGSPACGPAAATRLLQFIKKFSKVNVFVPFTNARDSGLWSTCTSCFSLRLYWLESKENHEEAKSTDAPKEESEQCNSRRNVLFRPPPPPLNNQVF